MGKRRRFLVMAVGNGYRWLTGVFDHGLRLFAVVALFGSSVVIIVIRHGHHKWLLGVSAVVLLAVALGEGAYQVWDETDLRLSDAKQELTDENSLAGVAKRLDGLAEEMRFLVEEAAAVPPEKEDNGYGFNEISGSANHVQERVRSELRVNAPEWLSYFSEYDGPSDPKSPEYDPHYLWTSKGWVACLSFSERQIRHISSELRKGKG